MPHNRDKTLFILRGLPGSGRSSRAWALKKEYNGEGMIISAAHYFRRRSGSRYVYDFNPRDFHRAHMKARWRALQAMDDGVDPVIINNPNIERWHMYPYILMAFNRGYWVEFEEIPNTLPFEEMERRSGVPLDALERMDASYEEVDNIFDVLNDDECINRWNYTREMIDNDW